MYNRNVRHSHEIAKFLINFRSNAIYAADCSISNTARNAGCAPELMWDPQWLRCRMQWLMDAQRLLKGTIVRYWRKAQRGQLQKKILRLWQQKVLIWKKQRLRRLLWLASQLMFKNIQGMAISPYTKMQTFKVQDLVQKKTLMGTAYSN